MKKLLLVAVLIAIQTTAAFAQNKVSLRLLDEETGAPIEYATVTLTKPGAKTAAYASLTTSEGKALMGDVKNGSYVLKAEILGYKPYKKEMTVSATVSLGDIKMQPDKEMLSAASVSAVGNPITIKKDTIEFNASSFKTTENDVLEDLLKKLPGVEVSEDGTITVNGQTISKITIDGKTFFLDDPQLASKNIPAKAIEKLKVIDKKSEQAAFTGIDDGEEEHVIDLSIKKGMMNGLFGNVMAGGGHDIPASGAGDWRYEGGGFVGKFSKGQQLSALVNINNTNNRGFNDLSGSMMQGMRGGGGGMGRGQGGWGSGNGITTSYMAGVNGVWDLLDNKMELGGNYLFNGTNKYVMEQSDKTSYLDNYNLLSNTQGDSQNNSYGHRFGIRLEHKFSENTSILFEPQINFGNGNYWQNDFTSTYQDKKIDENLLNDASTNDIGANKNLNTGGFFLLRQRLGIPGRTLTAMIRYNVTNNDLWGENHNTKNTYEVGQQPLTENVDQWFTNNQQKYSVMGRVSYTEPLGHNFYVEANYSYQWSKSTSDKDMFQDAAKTIIDSKYTSDVSNESNVHNLGANVMYQIEKFRAQLGVAGMADKTDNLTNGWDDFKKEQKTINYHNVVWKVAPQLMLFGEISENSNARLFYRANSEQPTASQLMPVPDNTNPLNITFGNPTLDPHFNHSFFGDYRYNNKKNFFSLTARLNGSVAEDPVVNILWYDGSGTQYNMPFNGPTSANLGLNCTLNAPIAKSNFSISNFLRMNWANGSSYVGNNIDMSVYKEKGFYEFMDWFSEKLSDPEYFKEHVTLNTTNTLTMVERLKFTYRNDFLELNLSGRTRMNKSWYSISDTKDNTLTWNNQIAFDGTWTWDAPGISVKADFHYNWYNGYTSSERTPEYILNAQISKMFCKKKLSLTLKGYDLLGQAKNLMVSDSSNYHTETVNNTLGRYLILTLTYRFGTFDKSAMRRGPGGPGGPPPMR